MNNTYDITGKGENEYTKNLFDTQQKKSKQGNAVARSARGASDAMNINEAIKDQEITAKTSNKNFEQWKQKQQNNSVLSPAQSRIISSKNDTDDENEGSNPLQKFSQRDINLAQLALSNRGKKQNKKQQNPSPDVIRDFLQKKTNLQEKLQATNASQISIKRSTKKKKSGSMMGKVGGGIAALLGATYLMTS